MTAKTRPNRPAGQARRYPCCAPCGKPVHATFYGWRHARRRTDQAPCADSPPTRVILSAKIIRIQP